MCGSVWCSEYSTTSAGGCGAAMCVVVVYVAVCVAACVAVCVAVCGAVCVAACVAVCVAVCGAVCVAASTLQYLEVVAVLQCVLL